MTRTISKILQIEVPGPNGPLAATLSQSNSDNSPLVLLIPGSGTTDRDGNGGPHLQASPYRLLAEAFSAAGISSLRIDKRGMFGSSSAIADANAVTIADYVTDVAAWIVAAKATAHHEKIWVLGHSEGGLVALAAAQRLSDIQGLLLVATPGRPLDEVLWEQLTANPANAPILEQARHAIEALKAGNSVNTTHLHPALMPLFRTDIQNYLMDLFTYDPAELARTFSGPLLVMQGDKDIQTGISDAKRLANACPHATLKILPNVNHVLKHMASDDRSTNLATYADSHLALADGVSETLTRFIKHNS